MSAGAVYALPGGQFLQSQPQATHGLGQPPVGAQQAANQFFWGAPGTALGKAKQYEKAPLIPKRRGLLHVVPHVVLPPLVFASSYYCWSFVDRLFYWWVAYAVSGGYLLTSLVLLLYNASAGKRPRPWLAYASAWLVVATAAGWYFGNGNFGLVSDFVTFKGMATYVNVNPSKEKGDGFADAGQVYFAFGVRIDESRAMMFKNTEKFCVAPIVELLDEEGQPVTGALSSGDMDGHVGETGAIDWWAVGINCCDDGFKCGDVGSPARSGLRILDTTERQFYEFAVHQFTAKYHIPSAHPLFFHWVMDPLGTVNGYMLQAQINWHTAVSYSVLLAVFFGVIARLSIDGMEP